MLQYPLSAAQEEAARAAQRHADTSRPATPVSSATAAAASSESGGAGGRYSGLDAVGSAAPIEDGGAEEEVVRAVRQSARLVVSSATRAPSAVRGQQPSRLASENGSVASAGIEEAAPQFPDRNALEVLRALDRGARARTDELGVLAAALEVRHGLALWDSSPVYLTSVLLSRSRPSPTCIARVRLTSARGWQPGPTVATSRSLRPPSTLAPGSRRRLPTLPRQWSLMFCASVTRAMTQSVTRRLRV